MTNAKRQQRITVVVEELLDGHTIGAGVRHAVVDESPDTLRTQLWDEIERTLVKRGLEAWVDARNLSGRNRE